MNYLCIKLSKKYRVATTTHINSDILCRFNHGLKLQDIGAISRHAKISFLYSLDTLEEVLDK